MAKALAAPVLTVQVVNIATMVAAVAFVPIRKRPQLTLYEPVKRQQPSAIATWGNVKHSPKNGRDVKEVRMVMVIAGNMGNKLVLREAVGS